jgi:hypothetical protein
MVEATDTPSNSDFSAAFDALAALPTDSPQLDVTKALDTPDTPTPAPAPVEASTPAPAPVEAPATTPAPPAGVENAPATPPAPPAGVENAPAPPPVEATIPAPPPVDTGTKISDEDLLRRFTEIARTTAPPAPAAPATPAAPAAPAQLYSPEEQTLISKFKEDWPDVAAAQEIIRRGEYIQLLNYIQGEFQKALSPLQESVGSVSERSHLADLEALVPDYADVRNKVIDWAGKQPSYLQASYNHVIQNGTAAEVADMISRYKAETGAVTAAPAPARTTPSLPEATRQAAAALAPVGTIRSQLAVHEDPEDFEGAFSKFAQELVKS